MLSRECVCVWGGGGDRAGGLHPRYVAVGYRRDYWKPRQNDRAGKVKESENGRSGKRSMEGHGDRAWKVMETAGKVMETDRKHGDRAGTWRQSRT